LLISSTFLYADPIILSIPETQAQKLAKTSASTSMSKKKVMASGTANLFLQHQEIIFSEPLNLASTKDLKIDEEMVNNDVNVIIHNQIDDVINVRYVGYNINNNICAENKDVKLEIKPKQAKSKYFVSKSDLMNCYKIATNLMRTNGTYDLIDVSADVNANKYGSMAGLGLFLLPVKIVIKYDYKNVGNIRYVTTYFIYAKK
ncbi:MAG: hypothetical protein ORN24_04215, partial [Burkholderiales bacterium]|nr:hypothetical protein [Burkholderiales bacterium]